jgi:hypothetical protein
VVKEAIEEDLAEGYREMDARTTETYSGMFLVIRNPTLSIILSHVFIKK